MIVKPDLRLVNGCKGDTIHIMSEVNRWKQIYHCLMVKASVRVKPEGYVEEHHIEPRSVGGSNSKDNRVWLTAREHLLAHMLWARMETDQLRHRKACLALWAMCAMKNTTSTSRRQVPTTRQFETARSKAAAAKTNIPRSEETKRKVSESLKLHFKLNGCHNKGRSYDHLSKEERSVIFGVGNKNRVQAQEEKDKRAQSNKKSRSPTAKENIRLGAIKREAKKRNDKFKAN